MAYVQNRNDMISVSPNSFFFLFLDELKCFSHFDSFTFLEASAVELCCPAKISGTADCPMREQRSKFMCRIPLLRPSSIGSMGILFNQQLACFKEMLKCVLIFINLTVTNKFCVSAFQSEGSHLTSC